MVPFTALHRPGRVRAVFRDAGVTQEPRMLPLPRPLLYETWNTMATPKVPWRWGADLVHAPSVAVPPKTSVPLVVTVHDAAPELFPDAFPPRGRRFHRLGLAAAARRADVVLTVSQAAAEEIAAHSEIPLERIRVVHNGVAPRPVDPARRDQILSGFGLLAEPYVLWVGSLEPRKGVDTLVSAVAELRGRQGGGSFRLVLAGYDGWMQSRPGAEQVVQLGKVTDEELWALYGGASVFAFPSIHEGFGLPVLEAMSQGTPVVASDIAALREVTAGAALLVRPGDVGAWATAIGDLLEADGDRAKLSAAGRARSGQLSVDAMVGGIREVYRELAGR